MRRLVVGWGAALRPRTITRVEQVTRFMAQGLSNKQIAERLNVTLQSAETYVRLAYKHGAPKRKAST
jgi:DNA-binding NarL/FixJ family response regulator